MAEEREELIDWFFSGPDRGKQGHPETTFDVRTLFFAQKKLRGAMASDIEDLEWGLEQVKAGKIKPLLDTVLHLSQAGAAHKLLAESRVKGNVVLLPWAA